MSDQADQSPEITTLELAAASHFTEYLKRLPSFAEAERELQGKSEREMRAMVLDGLLAFKQRQLSPDEYAEWSRLEPMDRPLDNKILILLKQGPLTARQIAETLSVDEATVNLHLSTMDEGTVVAEGGEHVTEDGARHRLA